MPNSSINSVAGVPNSLAGLGRDFFFNEFGRNYVGGISCEESGIFSKLCSSKNVSVAMCYATARQSYPEEPVCNPVAFFNNPAIPAAGESSQQALINHQSNSSF